MNFTSIKNIGRPGVGIRVFRGLIRPEFNDWIGSRWRSGTGLFKPVLLNFQRSADAFGQICWPQSRGMKSQFLFAPAIQLTFNSFPITNLFRESHTRSTSHQSISRPVFDVRSLLNSSRTSNMFNFQSSSLSTSAPGDARNWKLSLPLSAYLCVLSVKSKEPQRTAEILQSFSSQASLCQETRSESA